MASATPQFIFTGFSQEMEFRVFGFKAMAADRTHTVYQVRAHLALAQRYGIRLQELPLLCREVLERLTGTEEQHAFTYSEDEMRLYADKAAAVRIAAALKKPPRRPAPGQGEPGEPVHESEG